MVRILGSALLAAIVLAGCTYGGRGFDDPKGEMSVVGEPYEGCTAGRTFLFGNARNTGDVELSNIITFADVYDGGGSFLGRFEAPVSGGAETITLEGEEVPIEIDIIIDSLAVDQLGSFNIETTVGCGRVARAEYTFSFTTATFEEF
jgi:hypothetical protein